MEPYSNKNRTKLKEIPEENIIDGNNITNQNNDENKEYIISKKIIKPLDLQNFDISSHLHKNITLYDRNCRDSITNQSYYCITCKQSICMSCGAYEHKDHVLLQRDNCLFYDPNFFKEISNIINISLTLYNKKQSMKDSINKNISYIINHLHDLKNKKYQEIDNFFDKIHKNMNNLKKKFDEMKSKIETYYNRYNKFFNIKYVNEKINISDTRINNLDIENTIFLLNFDLMNLCDNKNLKVLDKVNEITNKINLIDNIIPIKINDLIQNINSNLELNLDFDNFEDFYYEVNIRTQKFSEFINHFRETVADIQQKTGNIDKIKELLELFDSKNKKNKDIIFGQKYFLNDNKDEISDNNNSKINKNSSEKKNINNNKINLKVNLNTSIKNSDNKYKNKISKSVKKIKNENYKKKQNIINPNKNKNNKFHNFTNYFAENHSDINITNDNITYKTLLSSKIIAEDITLNNRVLQRFFAYSAYEFYIKNFSSNLYNNINSPIKNNEEKNHEINHSEIKQRNLSLRKNNKNDNYNNSTKKQIFNNKEINNESEKIDSNQYNLKSLEYLSNYQNRYNSLKELSKPIIGTNQIQLIEPSTKKIKKKVTLLNKDKHGYSLFPDGCRHILINNTLYITGGNNKCGLIVLSYDILSHTLTRLPNLNSEHFFHSMEYIDNFDCILCIGGENSSSCEIMDLNDNKWRKLPFLNYPRANCNIYYNNMNEEIYVMFGMKGNYLGKNNKNIDKIELLELNNIDKGWQNVEYYKSCGIDFKNNLCKIIPFTKDKLIILGGNNMRGSDNQNFYAILAMNKKEIFQIDKQTMETIKLEEKKMRTADLNLAKIN